MRMSWMSMLYQTYENNKAMAGKPGEKVPLSTLAHMVANAQIEITISQQGKFMNASIVAKEDAKTLIPVTESSAGRSNGIVPHALSDTLSYIAGDYANYVLTEKEAKKSGEKFSTYIEALSKWKESAYTHPKVNAIYTYIDKKEMIGDLVRSGILICDKAGKFTTNKVSGQPYEKALVRFLVLTGEHGVSPRTWEDDTLITCYTEYYLSTLGGEKDLCYLTGENSPIATNHPKGIVAANYGAKLISANDTSNFTFRGRFYTANEACTISYDATQKAHNALTWLVAKQGVTVGNKDKRTYICWNPNGKKIPGIEDPFALEEEEEAVSYTEEEYKKRLIRGLQGYAENLQNNEDIVIMGLDAATTGRLSITYFNQLKASDYLRRLEKWGESCCWYFTDFTLDKKPYDIVKTPTVKQIVTYAFGTEQGTFIEVNDKIMKEQSQRIYYCMLDGQTLPKDVIHCIVQKASTPLAYSYGNHERVLSTACALISKYYNDKERGKVKMDLDCENSNRSYLFGRLLAIAEKVERVTYKGDETRITNAIRLQAAFVNHPMHTWSILENALNPYYQKLAPGLREYYKNMVQDVFALLQESDGNLLNKSLEDTYLIGYYAQRKALKAVKNKNENGTVKEEINNGNLSE